METEIESAVFDEELVILVTPHINQKYPVTVLVESGILWNRKGTIHMEDDVITLRSPTRNITVYTTGKIISEFNVPSQTPYFAVEMVSAVGISKGCRRSVDEIKTIIRHKKSKERLKFNLRFYYCGLAL